MKIHYRQNAKNPRDYAMSCRWSLKNNHEYYAIIRRLLRGLPHEHPPQKTRQLSELYDNNI